MIEDNMEFEIWIQNGIDRGWISEPYCETHDGGVWTEEEQAEWEEGGDPCAHVVRIMI